MPRLSHATYAAQHDVLHDLWRRSEGRAFAVLSATEQWDLHDFFAVTHRLSESDLREHRRLATEMDASLPHRAGRALKKLDERLAEEADQFEAKKSAEAKALVPAKRKYRKNTEGVIRVRSVVHPEPNIDKLAQALLEMAKEMTKSDHDGRDKRDAA